MLYFIIREKVFFFSSKTLLFSPDKKSVIQLKNLICRWLFASNFWSEKRQFWLIVIGQKCDKMKKLFDSFSRPCCSLGFYRRTENPTDTHKRVYGHTEGHKDRKTNNLNKKRRSIKLPRQKPTILFSGHVCNYLIYIQILLTNVDRFF